MKRILCLLMLCVFVVFAQAFVPLVDRADFAGHQVRLNSADYEAGNRFTTGDDPPTVFALGFIDLDNTNTDKDPEGPNNGDGLLQEHRVTLWLESDGSKVAEVIVPAGTTATLYDGFRWVYLETPIMLLPNTVYIVAAKNGSLDSYLNEFPVPDTANPVFVGDNPSTTWGTRYITPSDQLPTTGSNTNTFYGLANALGANLAPYDPNPANMSEGAGVLNGSFVDVDLAWKAGIDPDGTYAVNPAIKKHYVYLSADQAVSTDPNLSYYATIDQTSLTDPNAGLTVTGLNLDGQYRWMIEEGLDDGLGSEYGPGDPNNIVGPIWTFSTMLSIPVIDQQPEDILTDLGQTEKFTVIVTSISTPSFQWYKSSDNATDTPDDDTQLGSNSDTLIISNITLADEGYYFCVVSNDSGDVSSNIAKLAVKRLIVHWTLDETDMQDGQYVDVSTEDPLADNADPNNPSGITFVDGPYSLGVNSAINTDENSKAEASGSLHPSQYSNQLTVSAWIRLNSNMAASNLYGIVGKGTGEARDADNWSWSFNARNQYSESEPSVRIISWNGGDAWSAPASITVGEWAHVAATVGQGQAAAVYVNGVQSGYEDVFFEYGNDDDGIVSIGDMGTAGLTFPGDIDDIRIYNYGMDYIQIAELYNEVSSENVCIKDYASKVDFANEVTGLVIGDEGFEPDCKINLHDFAELASHWLECGLYPTCL